jgi:hypothetical protein
MMQTPIRSALDAARLSAAPSLEHKPYDLPPDGLPRGWRETTSPHHGPFLRSFMRRDGLLVMASIALYDDGRWWHHISLSRDKRLPTYDELTEVKRLFLGEQAWAVQLFPPSSEHVNIMRYCLHLFSTSERIFPDFTAGSGSI